GTCGRSGQSVEAGCNGKCRATPGSTREPRSRRVQRRDADRSGLPISTQRYLTRDPRRRPPARRAGSARRPVWSWSLRAPSSVGWCGGDAGGGHAAAERVPELVERDRSDFGALHCLLEPADELWPVERLADSGCAKTSSLSCTYADRSRRAARAATARLARGRDRPELHVRSADPQVVGLHAFIGSARL